MSPKPPTKEQRHNVLKRDGYMCRACGKFLPENELAVHHINTRGSWGSNEPENLITLCAFCHDKAHRALITKKELKAMIPALSDNKYQENWQDWERWQEYENRKKENAIAATDQAEYEYLNRKDLEELGL